MMGTYRLRGGLRYFSFRSGTNSRVGNALSIGEINKPRH
jgi:hypothetical protein